MPKNYSNEIKEKVEEMRKSGKTYKEIQSVFKIPKSTLSDWLGEKYKGSFNMSQHLSKIRVLANEANRNKSRELRNNLNQKIKKVVSGISTSDKDFQKAILISLYSAEGSKGDGALVFANTDPKIISVYLKTLRNNFKLDEKKFRVRVHIHHYHKKEDVFMFWSKLTKIPIKQFNKVVIKERSATKKFRRNYMGICFVIYHDTWLRREIIEMYNEIYDNIISD